MSGRRRETRRRPGRRRAGEAGFTLLETVVAIALIGLLSLVLMETLRFVGLAYERGVERARFDKDAAALRRLIGETLAEAQPIVIQDEEGELATLFDGGRDRLALVAPYAALPADRNAALAALAARPGLAALSFHVDARGLIMRHARFGLRTTQRGAEAEVEALLLSPGASSLTLRYYDAGGEELDGTTRPAEWRDEWRRRLTLPATISLRLSGGRNDGLTIVTTPRFTTQSDVY